MKMIMTNVNISIQPKVSLLTTGPLQDFYERLDTICKRDTGKIIANKQTEILRNIRKSFFAHLKPANVVYKAACGQGSGRLEPVHNPMG